MRHRALLLVFASLLAWAGCIDTAEPTGPVPGPPPDDGGELTAPAGGEETPESRTGTLTRVRAAS